MQYPSLSEPSATRAPRTVGPKTEPEARPARAPRGGTSRARDFCVCCARDYHHARANLTLCAREISVWAKNDAEQSQDAPENSRTSSECCSTRPECSTMTVSLFLRLVVCCLACAFAWLFGCLLFAWLFGCLLGCLLFTWLLVVWLARICSPESEIMVPN